MSSLVLAQMNEDRYEKVKEPTAFPPQQLQTQASNSKFATTRKSTTTTTKRSAFAFESDPTTESNTIDTTAGTMIALFPTLITEQQLPQTAEKTVASTTMEGEF